ncbi:hypothetical protein E2P81_ATG06778 [Venturia nashicola]|nr:hypothetical protein E2P81_ATG06778 [Venturia nashicola]
MSRFNNDRDPPSRYNPRDRSPPRFPDRRQSGVYSNNAVYQNRPNDYVRGESYNRDIPRGPRVLNDAPARPAPTGPRGGRGGGFGRGSDTRDFRDTRDGPNFQPDRWRDGEDRWERRTSPRARSPPPRARTPPRDRRDDRAFPKPIDTDRARLEPRDGPPSAGSNISDPPRSSGPAYRGGGFARGRGDLTRRYPTDDRNSFRPRSRSRDRVAPRERDRSVDSRDLDRRDRARETDDRRFYRDREDGGFFRREPGPRLDTRTTGDGRHGGNSAQSTPQSERPPTLHISPQDGPQADSRRPYDGSRRGSALSDGFLNKPPRDERPDLFAGRIARAGGSPPPSAPQVPAFGFRQPTFAGPTSISWKNPDLQVPKPPPASGAAQPFKGPPTAPRALSSLPPTAPKADRVLDRSKLSNETLRVPSEEILKDAPQAARQPPAAPIPVKSTAEVKQTMISPPVEVPAPSGKLLAPPSGPRAMNVNSQPFGRSPPIGGPMGGFGRAVSPIPPSTIPTGPRAGAMPTSPHTLPDNVPTGPKADRMAPTTPRGPPPNLMRANSVTTARTSIVPSKRDFDGQEREVSPSVSQRHLSSSGLGIVSLIQSPGIARKENASQPRKSPKIEKNIELPEPLPVVQSSTTVQPLSPVSTTQVTASASEDTDMEDAPPINGSPVERKPQDSNPLGNLSDDEDELDMTELLKEHEEKFNADKAKLEAKMIDLSREEFRPSLLLDHVVRLVALQSVIPDLDFRPRLETRVETLIEKKPVEESINGSIDTPAELPTPREEEQDTAMADAFEGVTRSSRDSSFDQFSTPGPESLPYLEKGPPSPLSDPDHDTSRHHLFEIANDIKGLIKKEFDDENDEQEALRSEFRELYVNWKHHTWSLDREKEDDENALKQTSPEAPSNSGAQEFPTAPLPTPTEGGRRANRFATEYEMQRILELSLEEDRERRQKEREAKEAQASASRDREADIPDMLPPAELRRRVFQDNSQARQPKDAIRIFDFVPPPDDFTEAEDTALRQEYRENIKAWGRIAKAVSNVPGSNGRTYKECINHYYATKWDRPYEKKQRGRKGRRKTTKAVSGKKSALVPAGDTDMVDADGTTPLVTDSGRPRRAAAPVWPKDPEAEQGPLQPPSKKSGPANKYESAKEGDTGSEKPGRRKGTKEKVQRKPRNQPLAARPTATAASPQKIDKEIVKDKIQVAPMAIEERPAMWEPMSMSMPQQLPTQQVYPESGAVDIMQTGIPASTERARSHSQNQRQGASSYWSVTEEQDFRKFLSHFGADFTAISNHMGTKTAVMVSDLGSVAHDEDNADSAQIKNHYHKLIQDGKNSEVEQLVTEAEYRKKRGEASGPPPVPSQPTKRRYDPIQTPMVRTLAPNTEVIDLEKSPSQPGIPLHVSPPQFGSQSRFPAQQQPPASRQPNPAGEPLMHQEPIHPAQKPPRPHTGPRMGYFADDSRVNVAHGFPQPALQAMQEPARTLPNQNESQTQRIARIKTEHDNNPSSRNLFTHAPDPMLAEQNAERERERMGAESERATMQQQLNLQKSQQAFSDTRARMQAEMDAQSRMQAEMDAQSRMQADMDAQSRMQAEMDAQSRMQAERDMRAKMQADVDARAQLEMEQKEPENMRQRPSQPNYFRTSSSQMPPSIYTRPGPPEAGRPEHRSFQTPFGMQIAPMSSAPSPVVDLTGPSGYQSQPPPQPPPQPQPRPFSPALLVVRPPSPQRVPSALNPLNPPPSRTMTPTPAPAPAVPTPAKDPPPKRVDIMSMLNTDPPEEERPRRREREVNTPASSGTPAQQYRHPAPLSETGTAREPYGEPQSFSRTGFATSQLTPGSSVSTPTSESGPRDGLPSIHHHHRDSWPASRPPFSGLPMQQQQAVGSPLSQTQHAPSMPEAQRPSFGAPGDYRPATLSRLNSRPNIPSPPPVIGGAYSHSRTPSYTQNPRGQPPPQPPVPVVTGSGLVRDNPYKVRDPQSSQPHLHVTQVVHPQNEPSYGQNRYAQPYDPPAQEARRLEVALDRFRERQEVSAREQREREQQQQQHQHQQYLQQQQQQQQQREREQQQQHQQHQEQLIAQQRQQYRYGHHTPPITHTQYAPPERSGPTPLGHTAYPPPDLSHSQQQSQQHIQYQNELARRDQERDQQRRERMAREAQERSKVQQQRQRYAAEADDQRRHQWRGAAPPPN